MSLKKKYKEWLKKVSAITLSTTLLAGGAVGLGTAFANGDNGSSASISTGGSLGSGFSKGERWDVWAQDTPNLDGNAFEVMKSAYNWTSGDPLYNIQEVFMGAQGVCTQARNDAAAAHGFNPADYRIVMVGAFHGHSTTAGKEAFYRGNAGTEFLRNAFINAWNNNSLQSALNAPAADRAAYLETIKNYALAALPEKKATNAFCVVLHRSEPPQNYELSVTTDAQSEFNVSGTSTPVFDRVTTSNNGSPISENINVDVVLNWDGSPDTGKVIKSVKKTMTMGNNTTADSPQFTPQDIDSSWKDWAAGKYWFDIKVAKQGKMAAAVDTADRESAETFVADYDPTSPDKELKAEDGTALTGKNLSNEMIHYAEITARSEAASRMEITDVIDSEAVWVGAKDHDDLTKVSVTGPNGQKDSRWKVTKTAANGKTTVKAEYVGADETDTLPTGDFKLTIPLSLKADGKAQTVVDHAESCWYTHDGSSKLCHNPSDNYESTKPKPQYRSNKVWVLSNDSRRLVISDETWSNEEGVDQRTFHPGDEISAKVIDFLPGNLSSALDVYSITDDWTGSARYIDFSDTSKHRVYFNGTDVTNEFTITTTGTKTTATAKPAFLARTKLLGQEAAVNFILTSNFKQGIDTNGQEEQLTNTGSVTWNSETKEVNEPPVFIRTPKPDKLWFVDKDGVLNYGDPNWTNNVAADNKVFLHGDKVGVLVNGKLPKNRATPLTNYQIADNWADNAKYVDFTKTDADHVKVYVGGVDRTSEFTITVKGTETIATAKASILRDTGELPADIPVKLVLFGEFKPLTEATDTQGALVKMTNSGWEKWNSASHPTNVPPVYIWNPDPDKDVIGSANQNGSQGSIDGLQVFPGQWLEYQVNIDLRVPGNTAWDIKNAQVEDVYDAMFVPNKSSLEFYDARTLKTIPRSAWSVEWFESEHRFMVTFDTDWVKKNVTPGQNPGWLIMRFDGKVKDAVADGTLVKNQAFEILNDSRTPTPIPTVEIPRWTPDKDDLRCDKTSNGYSNCVNIDGKTVVEKDNIDYRLLMDARPSRGELAYDVHKLGMVDDYDEDYLNVKAEDIKVVVATTDDTTNFPVGKNVTSMFNVQVKNGKAAIFAKTVDTKNYVTGETMKGDPQPSDLFAYDAASINPLTNAGINQSLLGKTYWVFIRGEVTKETDGYVIKNQARQNFENQYKMTKIVSNPLKDIDPEKDVVVSAEDKESLNGKEVPLNKMFDYALKSSVLPENRAYPTSVWKITDKFDPTYDRWTGVWAAYADKDIYENGKVVVKAGEKIADSENNDGMFKVTFDEDSYTMTAEAGSKLLARVNSKTDLEAGFTFYVKMERIAPSEKIPNVYTERHNNADRESNEVWTKTTEHPAISLVKFDVESDIVDGDRNTMDEAFMMSYTADKKAAEEAAADEAKANDEATTADSDATAAENATSGDKAADTEDATEASDNEVRQDLLVVSGVPGMTVTVTAPELDKPLTLTIDETGKSSATIPVRTGDVVTTVFVKDGVKLVRTVVATDKGLVFNSDEAESSEPLIAPVRIGFLIENIGDTPLKDITLTDETLAGSGHIENITCEEPLEGLILNREERLVCEADLVGVMPGDFHTDNAKVTGKSVFTDTEVSDEDPWNGKAPEKPSIDVTKWDTESGVENGDRNEESDALKITKDETPITFTIKNTGDVALKDVKLTDVTTAGDGTVEDITCDKDLEGLVLGVGETVECHGVLRGVSNETLHTDEATVTAKSVNFEKEVSDSDKWNGEGPVPPAPPVQNTGVDADATALKVGSALALISGAVMLGVTLRRSRKEA